MRFLLDVHVHHAAAGELRRRGLDVVHAADAGMAATPDDELLDYAAREGRIVVTRNYRDFAPLVEAYNRFGRGFPGVLFLAQSIPQRDAGAHVRALEAWMNARAPDTNPIADTFGWLR